MDYHIDLRHDYFALVVRLGNNSLEGTTIWHDRAMPKRFTGSGRREREGQLRSELETWATGEWSVKAVFTAPTKDECETLANDYIDLYNALER